MAAPQHGRVFLKTHQDCFIHAMPYFISYWNFSLALEGLGVVKVTTVNPKGKEKVFLSCISPTPLEYGQVAKGVHHRKYLEMDPRFAEALDVGQDTEVVLESVRNMEKCFRLKLAPKDPKDYEILCDNCEKITFELAERIRVVSCQSFFSFPIWINTTAIRVQVVSTEPSANWVLIIPDSTIVEIIPNSQSTAENLMSGATPATSTSHNSPNLADSDDESESISSSSTNIKRDKYTTYYPNRRPASIANTTHSGDSSVDKDTTTTTSNTSNENISRENNPLENTFVGSIIQYGRKLLNLQNVNVNQSVPPAFITYADEEEEEEEETSIKPVVSREPYKSDGRIFSRDNVRINAGLMKNRMHSELRGKMGDNLCVRSSNATPEPRVSLSTGLVDEPPRPLHRRILSEGDYSPTKGGPVRINPIPTRSMRRLPPSVSTPKMNASLRVQHHQISGVHPSYGKNGEIDQNNLWSASRMFDVFVHPSTLPEVYHYLLTTSSEAFIVELMPLSSSDKSAYKIADSSKSENTSDLAGATGSASNEDSNKSDSSLPQSLVVRMFFATSIVVRNGSMLGTVGNSLPVNDTYASEGMASYEDEDAASFVLKVDVKEGHVVMSDLVRQQLEIHECSRVRLMDVVEKWKIPISETINVYIHPVYPNKIQSEDTKKLGPSFTEWVNVTNATSRFGAVLVNRQIVPLIIDDSKVILCTLAVSTNQIVPLKYSGRIRFALITPTDLDKRRVTTSVDNFSVRRHYYANKSASKDRRGSGAEVNLTRMHFLNLLPLDAEPKHFGAIDGLLNEAFAYLHTILTGRRRCGTLLVCGKSGTAGTGCGKTSILRLMGRRAMKTPYHAFVEWLDCTGLRGQTTQRTKKRLNNIINKSVQNQPSVIILDNLDRAMPLVEDAQERVQEEGISSVNKTQVLRDLLEGARRQGAQILVVATAQNRQQLNKDLLAAQGRMTFDLVLEIQPPSLSDREEIIKALLRRNHIPFDSKEDIQEVAVRTEGFQAGDLVTIMDRAVSNSELRIVLPVSSNPAEDSAWQEISIDSNMSDLDGSTEYMSTTELSLGHRTGSLSERTYRPSLDHTPVSDRNPMYKTGSLSERSLRLSDFTEALEGFVPLSLRGLPLHTSGSVDFSHVGGLKAVKEMLTETLQWPIKYPELFKQCPIKQRCGVLLYGAPGTGKTLLAGAVAREFGLNFVSVKGPELLSKYIGASEKAVRDIFTRAQSARPCILFFDEFDSLAPKRGHDNTGVTDRVVNQLLTQLDGVEVLEGVYILAASSRPDLIDPALLRPGRIDMKICCDIPNEEDRYHIMEALTQDVSKSQDVDLRELARPCYTEHFTGADLKALIFNAQLKLAHEMLDQKKRRRRLSSSVTSTTSTHSLESSPEVVVKSEGCGASTYSYSESEKAARRHSVLPDDVQEKIQVQLQSGKEQRRKRMPRNRGSKDKMAAHSGDQDRVVLTQETLLLAVQDSRPSVSEQERKKYSEIYDKFTGKTDSTTTAVEQRIKQMVTLA